MIRAAFLALLLSAQAAFAGCLAFCDEEILSPAQAAITFTADLGQPMPEGVTVLGMLDGGFQDRFIQVKLHATSDAALHPLLVALRFDTGTLAGPDEAAMLTIARAPFWDIGAAKLRWTATGKLAGFAHVTIAIAPDPEDAGARIVYVIAFQT